MSTNWNHTLNAVHASSDGEPSLRYLPPMQTQAGIVKALSRLGLVVPAAITASADGVDRLRAAGIRYKLFEVDAALARTSLSTNQRMQFKATIDRAGLLDSNLQS